MQTAIVETGVMLRRSCAVLHHLHEFTVVSKTIYQYHLSHPCAVTSKLQKRANDIVEAHGMIQEVVSQVQERVRGHQLQFQSNQFTGRVAMEAKVGCPVEISRFAQRQQRHSNINADVRVYHQSYRKELMVFSTLGYLILELLFADDAALVAQTENAL